MKAHFSLDKELEEISWAEMYSIVNVVIHYMYDNEYSLFALITDVIVGIGTVLWVVLQTDHLAPLPETSIQLEDSHLLSLDWTLRSRTLPLFWPQPDKQIPRKVLEHLLLRLSLH